MKREWRATLLLRTFMLTGLVFLLLPGTLLGVWNLISISQSRGSGGLSPEWIQAHGHAQIFGWIGTFILGIGYYSLPRLRRSSLIMAWICWAAWSAGVALRWTTNIYIYPHHLAFPAGIAVWRWALPLSSILEAGGFLIFLYAVSQHKRPPGRRGPLEAWMLTVVCGSMGLLAALTVNLVACMQAAWQGSTPAFAHVFDQRFLVLASWGFLVLFVWGFSARWLPVFLGLDPPIGKLLLFCVSLDVSGVVCALFGYIRVATALLFGAAVLSVLALRIWDAPTRTAKTTGVHRSLPLFLRTAYGWLLISGSLAVLACGLDRSGGYWGASRHALTVGFVSCMVFGVGQRILPHFAGMKALFSSTVMLWNMGLLIFGCTLRVAAEVFAYENIFRPAWRVLPFSAILEMAAVVLFAANLVLTLARGERIAASAPAVSFP